MTALTGIHITETIEDIGGNIVYNAMKLMEKMRKHVWKLLDNSEVYTLIPLVSGAIAGISAEDLRIGVTSTMVAWLAFAPMWITTHYK